MTVFPPGSSRYSDLCLCCLRPLVISGWIRLAPKTQLEEELRYSQNKYSFYLNTHTYSWIHYRDHTNSGKPASSDQNQMCAYVHWCVGCTYTVRLSCSLWKLHVLLSWLEGFLKTEAQSSIVLSRDRGGVYLLSKPPLQKIINITINTNLSDIMSLKYGLLIVRHII